MRKEAEKQNTQSRRIRHRQQQKPAKGNVEKKLTLSTLRKTWIFDLDGTLVKHNGYLEGEDSLLLGGKEFLQSIPKEDYILILTGRKPELKEQTERFLEKHHIRYDAILFGLPLGERILFNDEKPSGLQMAHAVNLARDEGPGTVEIAYEEGL